MQWQRETETDKWELARPRPPSPDLLFLVIQGFLNLFLLFLDKLQFGSCQTWRQWHHLTTWQKTKRRLEFPPDFLTTNCSRSSCTLQAKPEIKHHYKCHAPTLVVGVLSLFVVYSSRKSTLTLAALSCFVNWFTFDSSAIFSSSRASRRYQKYTNTANMYLPSHSHTQEWNSNYMYLRTNPWTGKLYWTFVDTSQYIPLCQNNKLKALIKHHAKNFSTKNFVCKFLN